MTRKNCIRFSVVFLALLMVFITPDAEAAEDEKSALETGPSVRRKLLFRSTRFEAAPLIGFTSGDAYLRNVAAGINLNYYLTNEIGIGLAAGYAPLHFETTLAKNTKQKLDDNNDPALQDLKFSYMQWFAGLEFVYVPIFGKFSLMNSSTANYDLHLLGGLTLVGRGACEASNPDESCVAESTTDSELTGGGPNPAGTIGLGFRLFVGDAYSLQLQVRDHLYRVTESKTDSGDGEFKSNVFINLGFSFFFPQTVKISR